MKFKIFLIQIANRIEQQQQRKANQFNLNILSRRKESLVSIQIK